MLFNYLRQLKGIIYYDKPSKNIKCELINLIIIEIN